MFRPPSEAYSYILQATVGCSHNRCTFCAMYRDKTFRIRQLDEVLEDIDTAGRELGGRVRKVFVADGDSLALPLESWTSILNRLKEQLPNLQQVSCYATSQNILKKSVEELTELRRNGLDLLYLGPESGDDETLKKIAKGATRQQHIEAAHRAHEAGLRLSVIILLGIGGVTRSQQHAEASATLVTEMDPEFLAALTVTVLSETPLGRQQERGKFTLPDVPQLLTEMRTLVDGARPTRALFRTNHASNYVPVAGTLPDDRETLVAQLQKAIDGEVPLRPEWARGL